jgi:UDP-N-acetylglucosamine 2-epimerase (non-hydrolysing)
MKLTIIAGARPNFMKIAPIIHAINKAVAQGADLSFRLVHTGQHYDKNMSDSFFEQLHIPAPNANLECGGGTQAEQTANFMVRFEQELLAHPADLIIVVGDVTSTMACSIVAKKLNTKVAHVEGGIRSGDITMPEEVNRIVTDSITDYFFTTSEVANNHLRQSGVPDARIFFVGNTMIDTLLVNKSRFIPPAVWQSAALKPAAYIVLTLHRPANVDGEQQLKQLMDAIIEASNGLPLVFPVHPRTAKNLEQIGVSAANLMMIDPLSYLEFNYLVQHAKAVITDSGGITEEATVLGVPCITLRNTTERPETVTMGTNELIGTNPSNIAPALATLFAGNWKKGSIPPMWDGHTAERIVSILTQLDLSKR